MELSSAPKVPVKKAVISSDGFSFTPSKLVFLDLIKRGWAFSEVEYICLDGDASLDCEAVETDYSAPIRITNGAFSFRTDSAELRFNPDLVSAVESLGNQANTDKSRFSVVEVPCGVHVSLDHSSGKLVEWHRTWGLDGASRYQNKPYLVLEK